MLLKQKSSLHPRNLALETFGELLTVFSTKVNLLYLLYSTDQRCCVLHLIKQNYLLKSFLRTLIFMTLVSLYLFFLLELNCIIYPQLRRWLKRSMQTLIHQRHPDCIPVVVLKNCESELSFILDELFNMCLKESCFPKVSLVVHVFKNIREMTTAKTTTLLVFFLWFAKPLKNF